jgi:hypothetical protein
MKSYNYLEPRFHLPTKWRAIHKSELQQNGAVFTTDFKHLIAYPLDVWTPSDSFIKPQIADQVALGYLKLQWRYVFLWSRNYYKEVQNRLDYIDGADLIANKAIEQIILNGQLRSYGLEIMFRKRRKFNGWFIHYQNLSNKLPKNKKPNQHGQWYNSVYDKLHNVAITSSIIWMKMVFELILLQNRTTGNVSCWAIWLLRNHVPCYGLRIETFLRLTIT